MTRLLRLSPVLIVLITLAVACQKPSALTEEQVQKLDQASALASAVPYPAVDQVRRGCPACHVLVDKRTGEYTLAYEALANKETHPKVFEPTDEVNVTRCLGCHAAGTGEREGRGIKAPLSIRDIVHPAHMSSQVFQLHYAGNCFTCHNVDYEGEFELLTEKVDVNEKGVPNPEKMPIPGAIATGD